MRKKWNRPLIMLIKFIKKYIVSPIKSGMVIVAATSKVV
jgi:hypothetical protein